MSDPRDQQVHAVATRGLTKRYGALTALDGLDLVVPTGSVYALIGPNGAGKTTTFQILATLLKPTTGEAALFGVDPIAEPYEARKIFGYMPDFFGVYDDLRVDEYLSFFAAAHRVPQTRIAKVTDDLLELVDLGHKKESFVDALSRGMKQRLGLARALIHDPQLLILDEPASGLDPRARVELRELIRELQRMNKTVLISSHILLELEEVCDQVGILEAGRLLAQGSPAEMLAGQMRSASRAYLIRIKDARDSERLSGWLAEHPLVASHSFEEERFEMGFTGTEEDAADLLTAVVASGIPVTEFTPNRENLEDVFMRITKGVVQ